MPFLALLSASRLKAKIGIVDKLHPRDMSSVISVGTFLNFFDSEERLIVAAVALTGCGSGCYDFLWFHG